MYGILWHSYNKVIFFKIQIKYYVIWKDIVKFKPLSFMPGRAFYQLNSLTSFKILNEAVLVFT